MTSPERLAKLAAYVPTPVTHAIYSETYALDEPTARYFPAVVLFSDISGFTKLSEILSASGPTGAEELTHLINRYFTEMIQISQAYHGQVVKFSGDALTVLFQANPLSLAVRQAGECALAMQAKMSDFSTFETSLGPASLSMKVSIGMGKVLECSVGGVLGRWEYIVAGKPLIQVAMVEHYAQPGQIIFSPQAWQEAQKFFVSERIDDSLGFAQVVDVTTPLSLSPPDALNWAKLNPQQSQIAERALECYIPGAIKARLDEQADWLAELRRMTTVFIGIGGLDYESLGAVEQLQNFLQATQELVYRFEGSLNKATVDDKGTIMVVLFGAPPFSHEDDPIRAIAFALDLQSVAQEQGLRMTIGITEGILFAGPVGAPNRREYTVIGDQVNLAARLMQHGRAGTIIISDRMKERIGPHFATESLGQIKLKGKTQNLIAHLVKGELGTTEEFVTRYLMDEEEIIGRKAELTQLQQAAAKARAGRMQLLFIEGDLGMGKSRLVSELVREWIMAGGVGYGGKCISYDQQVSYRVWREVFASLYGLTPHLSPQRQLVRLATNIADLEDPPDQPDYWAKRLPLLADVLGLDAPDNDFTRTISGSLRRNNTFALIEMVLRRETERRPLLILLEDIQWTDELSLSLAAHLAQKMINRPLLLVLVHRPMSTKEMETFKDIKNESYSHTIYLNPLPPQECLDLIDSFLGGQQLPAEAKRILLSRGQGNPFFLQEIANAILNVMANDADQAVNLLATVNLPDTVQDVLLTHIDRLAEAERLTLKIASVIGTRFQRSLLAAVHPMKQSHLVLSNQLSELENEKLIRLEVPAPKWEYNFHNVVIQEVVYEGLLLAQRRQLHGAVANTLEKLMPDEVERLAFHYNHSNNAQKALYYLKIAVDKARREYANYAAIDYYTKILKYLAQPAAIEKVSGMISMEYWDMLLERAKLHNLVGQRNDELEDLGTLGLLAEALDDDYRRALAAKQWAYLYETSGDYNSSNKMIKRSVQLAEQAGAERLAGEGYNQWGKLLYRQGQFDTAHNYLQQALQIAQKQNDKYDQADSLNSLGIIAHYQADYEVALYFFQEAIDLRRLIEDQIGLGNSLSNIGQVYYKMDHYMVAQQCYNESLALHETIGDKAGQSLARLYLGQVRRSLGDFNTARTLFEESLAFYQSIGNLRYEAHTLYHLGFLYNRLGDQDVALTFLEKAQIILRELDDFWALANTLSYYAWTIADKGDKRQAQQFFEEAIKIENNTRQAIMRIEDLAHLGRIALTYNDLKSADYAHQILAVIEQQGMYGIEHPAIVYLTCYHIFQAHQEFEQAQAIITQGQQYLNSQIDQLDNQALQYSYINNIPENFELWKLTQERVG